VFVNGVERVGVSFSLPLVSVHVSISEAVMGSLPQVRLFRSRPLDVLYLKYISVRHSSRLFGSGVFEIVNVEGISDESWWVGGDVLDML